MSNPPSQTRLYIAVVCANIISFSLGTVIAWTSPMIPKLMAEDDSNPIGEKISVYQMSFIFSLLSFGAMTSCIFAGICIKLMGRKAVMYITIALYFLSIFVMFLATTIEGIYTVRIMEGFACGFTMSVIPLYIGEIATKENRGSCGTLIMFCMTLGQLYDYSIGPFITFKQFYLCILIAPIAATIGQALVPESPVYLMMVNRVDEATKSLKILRAGRMDIVQSEISAIQQDIDRTRQTEKKDFSLVFEDRINRKSFWLIIGLMVLQISTGAIVIVINSQTIFEESGFHLGGAQCAIIIGVVQVLSSFTLQMIVDRFKRRTLLKISAFGMGCSQFTLGTFFWMLKHGNVDKIRWSPLLAGIIFQISYRLGFGPIPYALVGEMLSAEVKAIIGPTFTLTCYGTGAIVTFLYPIINEMERYYVFYGFAINCVIAFFYVQFLMIETHGLDLKDIQAQL